MTKDVPPDRLTLLWAGALPWSLVGTGLLLLGAQLLLTSVSPAQAPGWLALLVFSALAAGGLKARFVLGKATSRTVARAATVGHLGRLQRVGVAIGLKALLLVLLMMALGYLVRHSGLPSPLRGWVCLAIGFALLWAARDYWRLVVGARLSHLVFGLACLLVLLAGVSWWA
jgi:hypothetical protein